MAKIQTESIVITFSRLIKDTDGEAETAMAQPDVIVALEQVAQELVGSGIIVEVNVP